MGLSRKILGTGRVAEPAVPADEAVRAAAGLGGSVQVRHVDAGSCNGCEIEIGQAFSPVYDAERYGARLVASPRHADVLTVTGPVTCNMVDRCARPSTRCPNPRWWSRLVTAPATAACSPAATACTARSPMSFRSMCMSRDARLNLRRSSPRCAG